MRTILLEEMTWQDTELYLKRKSLIIVPLGSIEQHGAALPLGTDAKIAQAIAEEVGKVSGVIVGPCIRPGFSKFPHLAFKGTISLNSKTLQNTIENYLESLYYHGFRQFLLVNGHGGNCLSITRALVNFSKRFNTVRYRYNDWWKFPKVERFCKLNFADYSEHSHADASETSLILYLGEQLIRKKFLTKEYQKNKIKVLSLDEVKEKVTRSGIINGDQTAATKTLGKRLFRLCVKNYKRTLHLLLADN